MSILEFPKKEEWDAHSVLHYALENTKSTDKLIVISVNEEGVSHWANHGFNTHELLWELEQSKIALLAGDY